VANSLIFKELLQQIYIITAMRRMVSVGF